MPDGVYTTKLIDVSPKIIWNYNGSYHSGIIKKAPNNVTEDDQEVLEIMNKKYNKPKEGDDF